MALKCVKNLMCMSWFTEDIQPDVRDQIINVHVT